MTQRPFYYTTIGADPTNADVVYAGPGDLCVMTRSREAALAMRDETFVPVDLAIIGIVDEYQLSETGDVTLKQGRTRYT